MFHRGFGFGHEEDMGPFVAQFRCNSMAFHDKASKEHGDKIILPMSAFTKLAGMDVQYPMQFELRNEVMGRKTHVGVLEFTAEEGKCYVPHWIMQNMFVQEGDIVSVRNVALRLATFVKFRPRSVDFLDISNPKAVLESALRNFSCLTKDDQICIRYMEKNFFIDIVELKPVTQEGAVSIVEADVNVEFDAPVGYVEPQRVTPAQTPKSVGTSPFGAPGATMGMPPPLSLAGFAADGSVLGSAGEDKGTNSMAELAKAREERRKQLELQNASYVPFSGSGRRVDGKIKASPSNSPAVSPVPSPGIQAAVNGGGGSSGSPLTQTPPAGSMQSKWKTRTAAQAFQGKGNSLS